MSSTYVISSLKDVNYFKILQNYRHYFAGKTILVTTNYKKLSSFKISFAEQNLPHLMGWSKVLDNNPSATKIINLVDNKKLTLSKSRKNPNFFRIKDRLLNYNFLEDIFYKDKSNICVMTRDMKPNPLKLDIVFYNILDKRHMVILGLRKQNKMKYFVPTTLHVELLENNSYLKRRKTSIKSLKWL